MTTWLSIADVEIWKIYWSRCFVLRYNTNSVWLNANVLQRKTLFLVCLFGYHGICLLRTICNFSIMCFIVSVAVIVCSSLRGVSWTYPSACTYVRSSLVSLFDRCLALLNYFWLIIWCKVKSGSWWCDCMGSSHAIKSSDWYFVAWPSRNPSDTLMYHLVWMSGVLSDSRNKTMPRAGV